jgi:uncharacterized RDD family membrane protein YckC
MEANNPYAAPATEVRDVLPGESVPLAGRGARFGAAFLDGLFLAVVVYVPAFMAMGPQLLAAQASNSLSSNLDLASLLMKGGFFTVLGFLAFVGVNIWLVHRNGQTIGKKLVGIKVVRSDSSRITLSRIFLLRNLPFWAVGFVPVVGQIVSLVDALLIFRNSRLCLHDQVAGTIVIDA